ncbi:CrcB family protein [Frondihabitans cladoniiphilus]|uniref:Fluoride-specific ion channel FluC n=1 Tax=Frondihabitans cladoniiphilus TaxID=715785 RepID=A0ABP8WAK7_9MICO
MTGPLVWAGIVVAGGLGSALRFFVDGVVKGRLRIPRSAPLPLATSVINATGSFGLGLLTGLAAGAGLSNDWVLVLGGGLMGGYTTFSTASVETVRLALEGRVRASLVTGLGMLVVAVAAASLGLWLGSSL